MRLKILLISILVLSLSACGGTPSVKKLVKDEALFKQTFKECVELGPVKASEEKKCSNLAEATKQKLENTLESITK